MDAEEKKEKCDARCRAGKCGRSELDCLGCEYMYNKHELRRGGTGTEERVTPLYIL